MQRVELSDEMANAALLVHKLALDRRSRNIGLEEYFAGIYLAHREALVPFWDNPRRLDAFVRECCGVGEPSWWHWVDFYMWSKRNARRAPMMIPYSPTLFAVLDDAANLALGRERKGARRPKLEVEHVVSALVRHPELDFTRAALRFGMKGPSPRGAGVRTRTPGTR
jgi:hypothetical protein